MSNYDILYIDTSRNDFHIIPHGVTNPPFIREIGGGFFGAKKQIPSNQTGWDYFLLRIQKPINRL